MGDEGVRDFISFLEFKLAATIVNRVEISFFELAVHYFETWTVKAQKRGCEVIARPSSYADQIFGQVKILRLARDHLGITLKTIAQLHGTGNGFDVFIADHPDSVQSFESSSFGTRDARHKPRSNNGRSLFIETDCST